MANGRVLTGFSMPWVALYEANGGTVTYSGGIPLARGVSVSIDVEASSDNDFYADNVLAETDNQGFSSGTVTLTVDGLKDAARKLIMGITANKSVTVGTNTTVVFEQYDDTQAIPYVGVGFVARYMEDGVTSYVPYVLNKVKFNPDGLDATTQSEEIEWQTAELEGTIMRDDSTAHAWKLIGAAQTSESAAVDAYKAILTAAT